MQHIVSEENSRREELGFTLNVLESYLHGKNTVLALDNERSGKNEQSLETSYEQNNEIAGHVAHAMKRKNDHSPLQALHHLVHTKNEPADVISTTYAMTSFPDEVQLCTSSIPGAEYGACAKKDLPAGTWIGPYEGRRTVDQRQINTSENNDYLWEIYEEGIVSHFIDGSDENLSSWMRFIRCARDKHEQNMSAYQYGRNIYYRSLRDITMGDELLVWYSDCYLKHFEIPVSLLDTKQDNELLNLATPEILKYAEETTSSYPLVSENSSTKPTTTSQLQSFSKPRKEGHVFSMDKSTVWDSSRSFKPAASVVQQTLANHIRERTLANQIRERTLANQIRERTLVNQIIERTHCIGNEPSNFSERDISKSNHNDYEEGYSRIDSIEQSLTWDDSGIQGTHVNESKSCFLDSVCSPFQCKQCLKVYTQRVQLQMHACPKSPYKPYQCGHCALSFAHSLELRNHVIIHTSERPFKCGFCGRSFAGATTLNNHVRTHTGEKPFVCNNCGKTFSIATQLSRHLKTPANCSKYTTCEPHYA